MAALARGKLRGKIPLLKRALEGYGYGATSILVVHMLGHIDYLEEVIAELCKELDGLLIPFKA